jgi:hypothetical protein
VSWFAMFLPWVVGCCVVAAIRGRHTHVLALVGSGFLLGQALVVAALYISLTYFGAGNARYIMTGLTLLLLLVATHASRAHSRNSAEVMADSTSSGPDTLAIALIGLALIVKLSLMGVAIWSIPFRNDGAISIWLFRAKVIVSLDHMPLHPDSPYYMGGSNPAYPIFGSLLAVWAPLATGGWSERLAVITWPLFYLSLIFLAAGGLRRWLNPLGSWLVAYLVASLPLMVIHVVQPGYMDLPLAAFLAAATLHMLWWRSEGTTGDFAIGIIFALAAACMKREGPLMAGILVGGFLLTSPGAIRRATTLSCVGIFAMTLTAAMLCRFLLSWSDQADAIAQRGYHPEVWPAIIRHCFQWSSFNLAFYILIAAMVLLVLNRQAAHAMTTWLIVLGLAGSVVAIFVLTPHAQFALNDQTPSRLFLQIIPAMALLLASSLARPQSSV